MILLDEIEIDDITLPRDQCNATSAVRESVKVGASATSVIEIINALYSVRGRDNACYFCETCEGKLSKRTNWIRNLLSAYALIKVLK